MSNHISFVLKPNAPFRLDLTVWCLRRRQENLVDQWNNGTYERVLGFDDKPVKVTLRQISSLDDPELEVTVTGAELTPKTKLAVTTSLERMLSIDLDLSAFYKFALSNQKLKPLVQRFRGLKPPRFPTLFEALVNGIVCQQISLDVGIRLLNRLTVDYGVPFQMKEETSYAFPSPETMEKAEVGALQRLGLSGNKAKALVGLSKEIAEKRLDIEGLSNLSNEDLRDQLDSLRGVGPWTVDYVMLRGLGHIEVFPVGDSGARGNLRRWLNLKEQDYESVDRFLNSVKPYGGLVYFLLLINKLAQRGYIQ